MPLFNKEYEVIDADLKVHRGGFPNSQAAHAWAQANMSGEQTTAEPLQEPNGWDIQKAGATPKDVQIAGAVNG